MGLLITPFLLQGLAMFFDEFYFHHRRGLPKWERIGHPLDTFSVAICYSFLFFQSPTDFNIKVYIGLCAFSCLLITKDEFVHTELCEARENWLHAVLFVLHPISFLSAGIIWKDGLNPTLIALQPIIILAFMFYQILYWSFIWKPLPQDQK
jgi:hypothetical protein